MKTVRERHKLRDIPIGEKFRFVTPEGETLILVPEKVTIGCSGCRLMDMGECEMVECGYDHRRDGYEVIFKEVLEP